MIKIGQFPSGTNMTLFRLDMQQHLPSVECEPDFIEYVCLVSDDDYETHQEMIDDFARDVGALVIKDLET